MVSQSLSVSGGSLHSKIAQPDEGDGGLKLSDGQTVHRNGVTTKFDTETRRAGQFAAGGGGGGGGRNHSSSSSSSSSIPRVHCCVAVLKRGRED